MPAAATGWKGRKFSTDPPPPPGSVAVSPPFQAFWAPELWEHISVILRYLLFGKFVIEVLGDEYTGINGRHLSKEWFSEIFPESSLSNKVFYQSGLNWRSEDDIHHGDGISQVMKKNIDYWGPSQFYWIYWFPDEKPICISKRSTCESDTNPWFKITALQVILPIFCLTKIPAA